MSLRPLPTRSAAALIAVGDPSRDRTVYATIVLLVALGLTMIMLAVWLLRNTRPDPEVLAPLERMGQRKWRRADPVWQRRHLDKVRPGGADPLEPMSAPPAQDADFERGPQPIGFDDLVAGPTTVAARGSDLPAPSAGAVAVDGPVDFDADDPRVADEQAVASAPEADGDQTDDGATADVASDGGDGDDGDDEEDDEDITGEQDTDDFLGVLDTEDDLHDDPGVVPEPAGAPDPEPTGEPEVDRADDPEVDPADDPDVDPDTESEIVPEVDPDAADAVPDVDAVSEAEVDPDAGKAEAEVDPAGESEDDEPG